MTLPCFACGVDLPSALPHDDANQPRDGVVFTSHGNYGSTVFDPLDDAETLEVNLCDFCLRRYVDRVLHVRKTPQPATYETGPWQP